MKKRQVLFVTYCNDPITDGFSYAMELAKAMGEDIGILLVHRQTNSGGKFKKLMSAATFAEALDFAAVFHKCRHEGIQVTVRTSTLEPMPGIRTHVKKQTGIDKVVLSPALTGAGNITEKDIKRLVRVISRPVVTMAKQQAAVAAGNG